MLPAFLCLFLLAAMGTSADVNGLKREIESRYHGAKTLEAAFFEKYSDGNGGIVAESGTVYFSRPGRMRWDYKSPQAKMFLVDGTNAWFYVPEDHTASRAKMKESSDWRTPLALLAGKADLSEICRQLKILSPDQQASVDEKALAAGNTVLRCMPRESDPALKDVLLETDPEGQLVRVVIQQAGNAETEFRFGNWEENIAIPEAMFHFQPPAGVAVVDEESLAGEIR